MARRKWKFSDIPGSKERLAPHAAEWIANALSTTRIADHDTIVQHVNGLYSAAGLVPPRDIIFVQSPFVAAVSGMLAAGALHLRSQGVPKSSVRSALSEAIRIVHVKYSALRPQVDDATYAATDAATRAATRAATYAATRDATHAATHDATRAATRDATYAATYDATDAATDAATYAATRAATYDATDAATDDATYAATYDATHIKHGDKLVAWLLGCISRWFGSYDGGSDWSAWSSYLSFGRVIGRTDVDYSKWIHYEMLARMCGPRILWPTFAIISERPSRIDHEMRNGKAVLHGLKQWNDGWTLEFRDGQRTDMRFEPRLPRHVVTYRDGVRQAPRVDSVISEAWANVAKHHNSNADAVADAETQMFAWEGIELWRKAS